MLCANCKKREATENWVGKEGVLAYTHGFFESWCKVCCVEEQLRFARELAETIPDLEEELRKLKEAEK